jgi:hypothetical protein
LIAFNLVLFIILTALKLLNHRQKYLREQYLKAYKNFIHTWNMEDKAMCDFEQATQELGG